MHGLRAAAGRAHLPVPLPLEQRGVADRRRPARRRCARRTASASCARARSSRFREGEAGRARHLEPHRRAGPRRDLLDAQPRRRRLSGQRQGRRRPAARAAVTSAAATRSTTGTASGDLQPARRRARRGRGEAGLRAPPPLAARRRLCSARPSTRPRPARSSGPTTGSAGARSSRSSSAGTRRCARPTASACSSRATSCTSRRASRGRTSFATTRRSRCACCSARRSRGSTSPAIPTASKLNITLAGRAAHGARHAGARLLGRRVGERADDCDQARVGDAVA